MVSFVFVYLLSRRGLCKLTSIRPRASQFFCIGPMMYDGISSHDARIIEDEGISMAPTVLKN